VRLYKRGLGERAAKRCERADSSRCRCRCQGTLHGATRPEADNPWQLPLGDPHHPETKATADDGGPVQSDLFP
jgi:hypothetical protein